MDSVVRANKKVCPRRGQLVGRREHQIGNPRPISGVDAIHVKSQGMSVHRDFWMIVGSEQMSAFESNCAVAECCALRAASDNADVLGHGSSFDLLLSGQL